MDRTDSVGVSGVLLVAMGRSAHARRARGRRLRRPSVLDRFIYRTQTLFKEGTDLTATRPQDICVIRVLYRTQQPLLFEDLRSWNVLLAGKALLAELVNEQLRGAVSACLLFDRKRNLKGYQASQFAGRHVGPALRRHPGSAAHHLLHVLWVTDRSHGESPKQESPCGVRAPGESLPVTMEKEDPVAKESISCQRPVSREKARTAACKGSVRKMPQRRKDG